MTMRILKLSRGYLNLKVFSYVLSFLSVLTLMFVSVTTHAEQIYLKVVGDSMEPKFNNGDIVVLDTSTYQGMPPSRGDTVGVLLQGQTLPMLKTVVAVGGDKVRIENKQLIVNSKRQPLRPASKGIDVIKMQIQQYDNRVPDNSIIVLGENQSTSYDSRQLGFISIEQLAGKVVRHKTVEPTQATTSSKNYRLHNGLGTNKFSHAD